MPASDGLGRRGGIGEWERGIYIILLLYYYYITPIATIANFSPFFLEMVRLGAASWQACHSFAWEN